ncbi:MAG: hypothetical protein ACRCX2_11085 [Paraclostridium sp.]
MIVNKYTIFKRSKFVILTLNLLNIDSSSLVVGEKNEIAYINRILELNYSSSMADLPPVNYIIGSKDFAEVKNPYLKHSAKGGLSAYDEDIIILIISNNILSIKKEQIDICSDIISSLSEEFVLEIKGNVVIPELSSGVINSTINKIEKDSVIKRNSKNCIFNILEYIYKDNVKTNDSVALVRSGDYKNSFLNISNVFSIGVDSIKRINKHLNEDKLSDSDIVVLPRITSVYADKASLDILKKARYSVSICDEIINSKEIM